MTPQELADEVRAIIERDLAENPAALALWLRDAERVRADLASLGTVAVPDPDDLWRRLLPVVTPAGGGSRTPADASGRLDSLAPPASSLPSPGSGLRPGAGGVSASGGGG